MYSPKANKIVKSLLKHTGIVAVSLSVPFIANATIVEFQTSQGSFQVNLFDQTTPKTVENFLGYVDEQHYTNSIVHRVISDFVVQGGGYEFNGNLPLTEIGTTEQVVNEPIYSNVTGTIAMAKRSGQPHSAADEWFINLEDNSDNLDAQNGGFTVFGQVIGDGMTVVNKIAALERCGDIPIVVDEDPNCDDLGNSAGIENLVVVEQITIIDSSEVTANHLTPLLSKYPDSDSDGVNDVSDAFPSDASKYEAEDVTPEDDDAGSFNGLSILMLSLLVAMRKRLIRR